MLYILEHGGLTLAVSSHGAEVQSLQGLGREWIWSGDAAVWGRHAPLCFPWCGRFNDGHFVVDGKRYEEVSHGFGRDMEHTLVDQSDNSLTFRLTSSPETLSRYPWPFILETCHKLEGTTLSTTCTVTNVGDTPMPFQIGFHFAFAMPLAPSLATNDHRVVFDCAEEAEEVTVQPPGLVIGREPRFTGQTYVELTDHIFDNDSICLTGLKSAKFRLDSDKCDHALEVGTAGFPYVLLWSKPGPMRFLCIEPWHGLPDAAQCDHDPFHRPGINVLQPGATFQTTHTIHLVDKTKE